MSDQTPRRPVLRAVLLSALLGVALQLRGLKARSVTEVLAGAGLEVVPGSLRWIDAPGFAPRRALLLAHARGERSDVFALVARTTPAGAALSAPEVYNLTRSPSADEQELVAQGDHAAFVTRTADGVVALTTVDLRGAGVPGRSLGARLRGLITRVQQTGAARGYVLDRYELERPLNTARLSLRGAILDASLGSERVAMDLAARRLLHASAPMRVRPRHESPPDNWLTWAVDTARAVRWIGPAPIAWAESWLFRTRHAVHRARDIALPERRAAQVDAELADLLASAPARAVEGRVDAWPPAPLRAPSGAPEPHEGEWALLGVEGDPFVSASRGAPAPMALTSVRVERGRGGRAYVVAWNPQHVELHVAPGSQEPLGATGETGTGVVPRDERVMTRLVGGFNGAFQGLHGEFGVYAEGTLLLPPKPYAATVAVLDDGSTAFGSWPRDQLEVPDNIVEFRQNLSALIDGGDYNPWQRDRWGAVLQTGDRDLRTARSGLCRTREGNVVYLWGNELSPRGLGDAMLAARCEYGMHLDMNGPNTGFDLYRVAREGELPGLGRALREGAESEGEVEDLPGFHFRARRLVRSMQHPAGRYLGRNPRDFFYLLRRVVLPGEPLRAAVSPALPGEGAWRVVDGARAGFPWPLARASVRPDPAQSGRWVNLLRVDPRRVSLGRAEATNGLLARVVSGDPVSGALRLSLSAHGARRWVVGSGGEGIAAEPLRPDAPRGACVDADGFLVVLATDGAAPGVLSRAMDLASCGRERVSLGDVSVVLPSGESAMGDTVAPGASARLALLLRAAPGARAIFAEVTPVPRAQWQPLQARRVRYFPNPASRVTVRVRLAGERSFTLRLPGVGGRYFNNEAGRAASEHPPSELASVADEPSVDEGPTEETPHRRRRRRRRHHDAHTSTPGHASHHREHGARERRHHRRRHRHD